MCRLPVAKNQNFGQILTFGGSCTDPLLPMRVKFGVLQQTQGLNLHAKFHLNVSASRGQKPEFWANFDFWGLMYRSPFTDESQMWCAIVHPWYMLICQLPNFVSIGLFYRPLAAKNPQFCQFLRFFGPWHLVLSPIGNSLTKLNTGAQLQIFPYPMASKSFLYSNAFMAKSGAQSLTSKIRQL